MRISILKSDRGYQAASRQGKRVKHIKLDGKPFTKPVVTVDDEENLIVYLVLDHNGKPIVDDPLTGELQTMQARGNVEIELDVDARAWDETRKQNGAKVQVGIEPGSNDLLVQVYSVVRPGAIKQMRLHKRLLPSSEAAIAQKAGMAAGAAAEALCAEFRDTIDPSDAARVATRSCLLALRNERMRHLPDQTR